MSVFRLLPFEVLPGPANMAADEVALELAVHGIASLRFFGWSEPTLSLGYFQLHSAIAENAAYSPLAIVRRSTGGGAIVHHHELTYALGLPAPLVGKEPWGCVMHRIIATALLKYGIYSDLIVCGEEQKTDPFLCFHHHSAGDLATRMRGTSREKIIGSAQRKQHGAILQHGSILLARSEYAPSLPGILEITGQRLIPESLALTIGESFATATGWHLVPSTWTAEERERRGEIEQQKYGHESWTKKR
jgi:lipoate-protein ligase A